VRESGFVYLRLFPSSPSFPFHPFPYSPALPFTLFPFPFTLSAMQASAQQEFNGARASDETIARAYEFADLSSYSPRKRFLIRAADLAFFVLIKTIGRTIRWEVDGWENWEAAARDSQLPIYTCWHNRIFLSTYFWRNRRIVVMTSQSFDGEYIARFIQRFGYGAARGSSTRGAVGAIVEMARLMRAGSPTGFTIDGPKGPRYIAKVGAALLAKKTGQPILPFTITARTFWQAKRSWDGFQVPFPFSCARIDIAPPIYVSAEADDDALEAKRVELQASLDRVNRIGKEWAGQPRQD
jgi:lysophospholipid acyltransferase (LPLAT)-like uncharacterized protein